jgi:hypothetical protein
VLQYIQCLRRWTSMQLSFAGSRQKLHSYWQAVKRSSRDFERGVWWQNTSWFTTITFAWSYPGLLFIPQVICEHGEPWEWCQMRKTDSSTSALGSPTNRDIWDQVSGMDEGVNILHISIWDASTDILTCRKILRHWASGFYFPSKGRCDADFYRP